MKPKILPVLEMCIEDGLSYGYMRAYKHNENPTAQEVQDAQHKAIMSSIWEWFDMGEIEE